MSQKFARSFILYQGSSNSKESMFEPDETPVRSRVTGTLREAHYWFYWWWQCDVRRHAKLG